MVRLQSQPLIFSQHYLPCQVLGLNFSDPWCLDVSERPFLLLPRKPTAHFWQEQVSLLAPSRFLTKVPGGSY